MKASFTLDEDDEDDFEIISVSKQSTAPSYHPMPTRSARKFISDIDKTLDHSTFAFCNNEDQTLFLGSDKSNETELTLYKVQDLGPVSASDSDLLKSHHNVKDAVWARAIYNLSDSVEEIGDEDLSSLKLR